MIKLRDYQEDALSKLKPAGTNLLSICPGGGKTLCAIEYINRNPKFKKVLVLAHAQNVLKGQWTGELQKLRIRYSMDPNSSERLVVNIPQALQNTKLPKFDLVVVDEAHEWYLAKEVQRLIKSVSPKCTLLLTGTPSKLIASGITPVIIPATRVYQEGYLMNANIHLVKSKYELKDDHYNKSTQDVKSKVVLSSKDTENSLERLVAEMVERLKINKAVKSKSNVINTMSRLPLGKFQAVFGKLEKTLIAAHDTAQAKQICTILKKNGVSALTSLHKDDPSSENVTKFQEDRSIQVLVVVRRGILGFNMPELVNVVDFTMSRNIDRIYQLMARVLRKHEGVSKKYYFRLCSTWYSDLDKLAVTGALCLGSEHFMAKYNGKNLKDMEIPEIRARAEKSDNTVKGKKGKPVVTKIDAELASFIKTVDVFDDMVINGDSSRYIKDYALTSYGRAMAEVRGEDFCRRIKQMSEEVVNWLAQADVNDKMPKYLEESLYA